MCSSMRAAGSATENVPSYLCWMAAATRAPVCVRVHKVAQNKRASTLVFQRAVTEGVALGPSRAARRTGPVFCELAHFVEHSLSFKFARPSFTRAASDPQRPVERPQAHITRVSCSIDM